MTEFVINTPTLKENIFYLMDIYNDAASRALQYVFPQWFLCSFLVAFVLLLDLFLPLPSFSQHLGPQVFSICVFHCPRLFFVSLSFATAK